MTYAAAYTRQFDKVANRCQRGGDDSEKFKAAARILLAGKNPDPAHRGQRLVGNFAGGASVTLNRTGP